MHFDLIDKVCAESYSDLRAIQFPQSILSALVDESGSVIVSQERKVSLTAKLTHTKIIYKTTRCIINKTIGLSSSEKYSKSSPEFTIFYLY